MGRTPKNLPQIQDRRAEVVRLRAQGQTWEQIAAATGYANGSGALKAWRKAIAQKPDLAVTEVRAQEAGRLEYLWAVTADLIEEPGPRSSAIGKVVCFPEGHPRAGEIVPDNSVRLRAIHEYRQQSESYRKLTGADVEQSAPLIDARTQVLVGQINQARADRGERPIRIPDPASVTMSPDQAKAACDAALAALQPKAEVLRNEAIDAGFRAAGQAPPPRLIQGELAD